MQLIILQRICSSYTTENIFIGVFLKSKIENAKKEYLETLKKYGDPYCRQAYFETKIPQFEEYIIEVIKEKSEYLFLVEIMEGFGQTDLIILKNDIFIDSLKVKDHYDPEWNYPLYLVTRKLNKIHYRNEGFQYINIKRTKTNEFFKTNSNIDYTLKNDNSLYIRNNFHSFWDSKNERYDLTDLFL